MRTRSCWSTGCRRRWRRKRPRRSRRCGPIFPPCAEHLPLQRLSVRHGSRPRASTRHDVVRGDALPPRRAQSRPAASSVSRGSPATRTPNCSSDGSTPSSSRPSAQRRTPSASRGLLVDIAEAGGQRRAVDGRRRAGRDGAGARLPARDVADRSGVYAAASTGVTATAPRLPPRRCSTLSARVPATWCCSPTSPIRCRTGSIGGWASCPSARTCSTRSRRDADAADSRLPNNGYHSTRDTDHS